MTYIIFKYDKDFSRCKNIPTEAKSRIDALCKIANCNPSSITNVDNEYYQHKQYSIATQAAADKEKNKFRYL